MSADELQKFLDGLGQRLTPAASHVWELAIRQQIINGVLGVVLAIAITIVWTVIFVVIVRSKSLDRFDKNLGIGLASATGLMGLMASVGAAIKLANPEWAALQDILKQIHGS